MLNPFLDIWGFFILESLKKIKVGTISFVFLEDKLFSLHF